LIEPAKARVRIKRPKGLGRNSTKGTKLSEGATSIFDQNTKDLCMTSNGLRGAASIRLFSYGTLQLQQVQVETLGRTLAGNADALIGFKQTLLEITDPEVLKISGERFHPVVVASSDPTDTVAGTVFWITPEELAAADRYEVSDYQRVEAKLASGGRAWVYVKA
jgi:hypothetical protein